MDEQLNAMEILRIANQVSDSTRDFYDEATSLFAHHSNLFLDMVRLEDDFAQTLTQVKADFLDEANNSPHLDDSLFKSVAGLHILSGADPSVLFHATVRKNEIINIAIKLARDIVNYFNGLENFTVNRNAKVILRSITKEKNRQISILKSWLN